MTDQQTSTGAEPQAPPTATKRERIPVLWFDRRGCGPDQFAIELHPFPAELEGKIPAHLGLRVRAGDAVIVGGDLIDGGFYIGREQAEQLHHGLGAWLEANPIASAPAERVP